MLPVIKQLALGGDPLLPVYGSPVQAIILESIENLALAVGTIVRSPARHDHPPDRCPAYQARLSSTGIDPVLELEKAFYAGRIHVVRNRGTAQRNCFFEDTPQAGVQAVKLRPF
jgi:hypothetical protein